MSKSNSKFVKAIEHVDCPFVEEYNSGKTISVNGKPMLTAIWKLIVSKRDISLYTKCGIIPTRGWKVSTFKKYFGITGSGQKLMDNFMALFNQIIPEQNG